MSLVLGDNFDYKSSKPLDNRLKYDTVAQMKAVADSTMYDGCTAYNKESDKTYQWKSTNTVDETLGRWREFSSGGSGTSDYSDLENKPQIEGVTLSGNKSASDLGLVTKAVNDLVNYWLKTETYSKTEVDTIVTAIKNSRFEVVATLPTTNIKTNVIYLVPSADPQTSNTKDEYINLNGTTSGWEKIGSTSVDLSGYVTETELNTALADYTTTTDLTTLLNGKQDVFRKYSLPTATEDLVGTMYQYMGATNANYTHGYWYECVVGTEPNTYKWQQTNQQPSSGGGGSYTAGDGIDITNDVISTKQSEEGDIDEIIDVYPTAGNLVSIVNAFNRGDIYSENEKMIGQWIDGKPIYQRTFVGSTSSTATTTTVANVNGITVINGTCVLSVSNSTYVDETDMIVVPFASAQGANSMNFAWYVTNKQLFISMPNSSYYNKAYIITLQYTKTTDTAISIGEATEYSTDEKIVGTWIDGKPVYQRTIYIPSITDNMEYDISSIGVSQIISTNGYYLDSNNNSCPLTYIYSGSIFRSYWYNSTKIGFHLKGQASTSAYITIQYTKTTT